MAWQRVSIGAAILAMAMWLIPAAPALAAGPVVHTAGGDVAGKVDGSVKEWLGIPYAAPPVGNLRWKPPAAASSWSGTRDATSFAPDCIQQNSETTTEGSEDCLYLNVYVPASATASSNLPVMVHFHPGGNSAFHGYQSSGTFTDHGVIVVTLNYRLGVFGFLGHPLLSAENGGASGEYGLLDQMAALRWVKANVAGFGGNPANVTMFGSSAGAFDAAALVASPMATGLFQKAAIQGTFFTLVSGQFNTMAQAEQLGTEKLAATGCNTAACLRSKPASELVLDGDGLDIQPWTGGQVLPQTPLQLLAQHPAVPLLMGNNLEEDANYYYDFDASQMIPFKNNDWVADATLDVGANNAEAARKFYPDAAYDGPVWQAIALDTDAERTCPVRQYMRAAQSPTVWRYTYAHTDENDPFFTGLRSSHILEEQFLWGDNNVSFLGGHVNTAAENTMSSNMTSYWTNFAKTGNPNGVGLPTWPSNRASGEPTLKIDENISTINKFHDAQCNFIDQLTAIYPDGKVTKVHK